MRDQAGQDEQLSALMQNLRGQNLDQRDFAADDVEMRLVEVGDDQTAGVDPEDALPLAYDPERIARYWGVRPVSVVTRLAQLASLSSGLVGGLLRDYVTDAIEDAFSSGDAKATGASDKPSIARGGDGRVVDRDQERAVRRAAQLRQVLTSLGPAYIKLGQALSIRPDLLSPAAMTELQKLCDKVPSFDSGVAFESMKRELNIADVYDVFSEISPEPVAAASLGQVYVAKLRGSGDKVAVKVQRPFVLETVTIDLFIVRSLGKWLGGAMPQVSKRVDIVALLDEWASRFFEELDYRKEEEHTTRFAQSMAEDLPQVVVPRTYPELTSRRVLVTEWIEGEKLAQSTADDVGDLVNLGVICYLKQLLDTGFFHADPHPGNMIRTPEGRLAVLDFGLMTEVEDDIK